VRSNREASAASPLLEEALRHASDPAIELQIRLELVNPNFRAPTARSNAHAERAIELATAQGDPGLLAAALASQAALRDHPIDALERAAAIEADSRASVQARFQVAWAHLYRGSDTGRVQLGELLDASEAAGLRAHNRVISLLSCAETRAGDPRRGRELAEEFLQYGVAEGNLLAELAALCARAYASAWLSDIDSAKVDADRAIAISDSAGYVGRSIQARGIRGFIDLTRGDVPGAIAHFRRAVAGVFDESLETLAPVAHTRLVLPTVVADAVDTFCTGGFVDECDRLVVWLARDPTNPWLVALGMYARGLVAGSRGEHDASLASLHEAVQRLEALALPLDLGRALLALGAAQRRSRHRSAARDTLDRAATTFERAGAEHWADKARSEIDRIGGRRAFGDELTPSEQRIASLVAEGKKNREVAAALVVTERTVEAALTLIYRKLDVRSRTELARKLRAG
jgi:DNA-binding CsgD family transcriptional regulator